MYAETKAKVEDTISKVSELVNKMIEEGNPAVINDVPKFLHAMADLVKSVNA